MVCTECLGDQCPRGVDYFVKVKAVAARFKANPAGIKLEALIEGITERQGWFNDMRACTVLVLRDDDSTYVAENRPTPGSPKIQYLKLMSLEEEKRTRHTPHR